MLYKIIRGSWGIYLGTIYFDNNKKVQDYTLLSVIVVKVKYRTENVVH